MVHHHDPSLETRLSLEERTTIRKDQLYKPRLKNHVQIYFKLGIDDWRISLSHFQTSPESQREIHILGLCRVKGSIWASLEIAQGDTSIGNINTFIRALINHGLKRPPDRKVRDLKEGMEFDVSHQHEIVLMTAETRFRVAFSPISVSRRLVTNGIFINRDDPLQERVLSTLAPDHNQHDPGRSLFLKLRSIILMAIY